MTTSEQSQREQGAMLRTMRVAAGVSQADLARAIGISAGHLSHIEQGNRPLTRSLLHAASSYIADVTRGAA